MRAVKTTERDAYRIHHHFVTPVKYRKAIFGRLDRERTPRIVPKEIEGRCSSVFEKVGMDTNHVHYAINAELKFSPSRIIQITKSIMAKQLFKQHSDLKKELWGGGLWTDGFHVATIGEGGGLDAIRAHVAKQGIPSQNLKLFD